MQPSSSDPRALVRAGTEAMRAGDASKARVLFTQAVSVGPSEVPAWVGLAYACHAMKDSAAKLAALERALALEPRNLRALILKADHYADAGDARTAAAYYRAAITAAPALSQLPPHMQNELRRAQAMNEQFSAQYEAHLRNSLRAEGFSDERLSNRFVQSLDILLGKKKAYFQEPLSYFLPELPQIQFYKRSEFPWLGAVEAATDGVRRELLEALNDQSLFTPYVEGDVTRPLKSDRGMPNNLDWSALFLRKNGSLIVEKAARFPKTLAALEGAPLTEIKNRAPSILFSLLRPGARIPPHTGFLNTRLICHLPLIVPEDCGFRVGNQVRTWVEGQALVFDDTIEHEAWNGSDRIRVVLIFDVWRPEITQEERKLIAAMLEAIDAYGEPRPNWDS